MLDQEPLTASHEYTYNERDTLAEMEWRSQPKQHDHDELRPRKRQKTIHHSALPTPRREDYTIAWICALHIEMAAARAMLDECHEPLPIDTDDNNTYVLGRIKRQNIVIACLPTGQYGTNNAANVMTNMRRTFTNIRDGLMVGIGGGAPGKVDVRLGDIVVGTSVIQYDLGKILGDKQSQLHRTATPRFPRPSLLTAASTLRSKHELCASQVPRILRQRLEAHTQYSRPSSPDRLFHATYSHQSAIASCNECDQSKLVPRCQRAPTNNIMIHYGAIASGNQVMKHSTTRDTVTRELDVICFEMEAAGLMDILPCLPIRGICDYSDSHKSNEWQRYAAATAAAYARELIEELPVIEAGSRTADSQARSEMDELQQTNQALKMEVRELNVRLRLQQSRLSPQVPYRNLVAINDALGETYSFSLNYIDSFELFVTVLRHKFEHVGLGKIERGEWMLQNHHTGQTLNLNRHWKALVKPGQTLDMSMIFRKQSSLTLRCPWCDTENECLSKNRNIECQRCSGRYQRIEEVNDIAFFKQSSQSKPLCHTFLPCGKSSDQKKKRDKKNEKSGSREDEDDIHLYTRVQMVDVRFRFVQLTSKNASKCLLVTIIGETSEDFMNSLTKSEVFDVIAASENRPSTESFTINPSKRPTMMYESHAIDLDTLRQQEEAVSFSSEDFPWRINISQDVLDFLYLFLKNNKFKRTL